MEQEQPTEGVQQPPTQDPSSSGRRRRTDPDPVTNEDILRGIWQQNQLAAQREAQQQTQHTEMMNLMRQIQQGQVNQGQRIDDVIEEMSALTMRVQGLHDFIHHVGVPDHVRESTRGRARDRGRGRH